MTWLIYSLWFFGGMSLMAFLIWLLRDLILWMLGVHAWMTEWKREVKP